MMEIKELSYPLTDYESIYERAGKVYIQCFFSPKDGISYFVYRDYPTRRKTKRQVICNFDKTKLDVCLDYIAEKTNKPVEYYFTHQQEAIFWALKELKEEVTTCLHDWVVKHETALEEFGKALVNMGENIE